MYGLKAVLDITKQSQVEQVGMKRMLYSIVLSKVRHLALQLLRCHTPVKTLASFKRHEPL